MAKKNQQFFFEIQWFDEEGFLQVIKDKWDTWIASSSSRKGPMDTWHLSAGKLRQFLRGWGPNRGRDAAVLKADMHNEIMWLDGRADLVGISELGWQHRYVLKNIGINYMGTRRSTGGNMGVSLI